MEILSALGQPPQYLAIDGGHIAYEDSGGDGPVVICVPGLGDTRGQFRKLAPRLVARGYRVLALDPRGHGQSSVDWDSYAADAVGGDLVQLIDSLGREVQVIGNSAGAAAAVWAAAELPQNVQGLVLIGPFVRDMPMSFLQSAMIRIGFAGPWAAAAWGSYYRGLYPSAPPADLANYIGALKNNLREPGRMDAVKAMIFASKADVERRLDEVRAATLVVMGGADPDFSDPLAEAEQIADRLPGEVLPVPGAGHYPHVEMPEPTGKAIASFLDEHR